MAPFPRRKKPRRTLPAVRDEIAQMRQERMSWRQIANTDRFRGVSAATLCAIHKHGRMPRDPKAQLVLGLLAHRDLLDWRPGDLAHALREIRLKSA